MSCQPELRLVVPSNWVRIRQPFGVMARWSMMTILATYALVSVSLQPERRAAIGNGPRIRAPGSGTREL